MKYAIIMMNYPFVYLTTIMLASLPVITLNAIAEEITTTTTTTTTTTASNSTNASDITSNTVITLGTPIFIENDKTVSLRSSVVNGSRILEAFYIGNGTVKEVGFTAKGFNFIATKPDGGIYSQGRTTIMTKDNNERADYVFQAIAHYDADGRLRGNGAAFFTTNSTGKLAIVKNLVIVYKDEATRGGNIKTMGWEWK